MSIQRYIVGFAPNMAPCAKKYDEGDYVLYTDHATELHNLLSTLADIRAALGVGDKPMLSELAGIIRAREADHAAEVERLNEQLEDGRKLAKESYDAAVQFKAERDAAVRERDAAMEALRFYAREENWKWNLEEHGGWGHAAPCDKDKGERARAALAKIEGGRNA